MLPFVKKMFSIKSETKSIAVNKSKFITRNSGLKYKKIVNGKGPVAKLGDTISANYILWLEGINSNILIQSSYHDGQPFQFTLGTGNVIKGWDEIFQCNMRVGTKRYVIVPPNLAYEGDDITDTTTGEIIIPKNSTLYFLLELVSIDNKT